MLSIKTYSEAFDFLGGLPMRAVPDHKKTWIIWHPGEDKISVRYHYTDVVTYYPDGRVQFNSGGWRTHWTTIHINEFSFCVQGAKKGVWWIGADGAETVPFADNMILHPNGRWEGAPDLPKQEAEKRLRKKILAYSADYLRVFLEGKLTWASPDCMYCVAESQIMDPELAKVGAMVKIEETVGIEHNRPVTRAFEPQIDAKRHILEHVELGQYPARLIWSAQAMLPVSISNRDFINSVMHGYKPIGDRPDHWMKEMRKLIYRYLFTRLGLPR